MRRFGALLAALISALIAVAPAGAMSPGTKAIVLLSGVNGQTFPGSTVDDLFTKGLCTNKRIALPCAQQLSTSRASTGLAQWADGHWSSFATNTLRMTDQGLLVEEARTNSIRNNTMQGAVVGTPGTRPTFWLTSGSGVVPNVAALASQNGLSYVEMNYNATPGSSGGLITSFENSAGIAALTGQTWTVSAVVWLSSGSFANVSTAKFRLVELDSGGGTVLTNTGADFLAQITAVPTRFTYTVTLSGGATTAFIQPQLVFGDTSGLAVNFNIRIAAPQTELGAFATSPTLTTNAAATRAADIIALQGPALTAAVASHAVRAETNLVAGIVTSGAIIAFSGSSANGVNYIGSNNLVRAVGSTVSATATMGSGTWAGLVKVAASYDGTDISVVANGGTKVTAVTPMVTTGVTTIGDINGGGGRAINGYLRRLTFGNAKGQFDGLTQ